MILGEKTFVDENCPAKGGNGVNLVDAEFVLYANVNDARKFGGIAMLEVWGVFVTPSTLDESCPDYVGTSIIEVPFESPAAHTVAEIMEDESGAMAENVGRILKTGAAACECYFADQCPKLDEMQLLFAIEAAAING